MKKGSNSGGKIKLRAEINKKETKRSIQRNNETKRSFSEKINKIQTPIKTN